MYDHETTYQKLQRLLNESKQQGLSSPLEELLGSLIDSDSKNREAIEGLQNINRERAIAARHGNHF